VNDLAAQLARCNEEIARCEAELRAGNPDIAGATRGLVDWACERRMILAEMEKK
jgi:hypothetical protein